MTPLITFPGHILLVFSTAVGSPIDCSFKFSTAECVGIRFGLHDMLRQPLTHHYKYIRHLQHIPFEYLTYEELVLVERAEEEERQRIRLTERRAQQEKKEVTEATCRKRRNLQEEEHRPTSPLLNHAVDLFNGTAKRRRCNPVDTAEPARADATTINSGSFGQYASASACAHC